MIPTCNSSECQKPIYSFDDLDNYNSDGKSFLTRFGNAEFNWLNNSLKKNKSISIKDYVSNFIIEREKDIPNKKHSNKVQTLLDRKNTSIHEIIVIDNSPGGFTYFVCYEFGDTY